MKADLARMLEMEVRGPLAKFAKSVSIAQVGTKIDSGMSHSK
jgi:hypothetical protein